MHPPAAQLRLLAGRRVVPINVLKKLCRPGILRAKRSEVRLRMRVNGSEQAQQRRVRGATSPLAHRAAA